VPATAARPQLVPNVGALPVVTGDRAVAVPVGKFEPGVEVNLSLLDDPEAVAKVVALLGPLPEWTLGMAQLACGGHEASKRGSQAGANGLGLSELDEVRPVDTAGRAAEFATSDVARARFTASLGRANQSGRKSPASQFLGVVGGHVMGPPSAN
jgi:hypothetical protein